MDQSALLVATYLHRFRFPRLHKAILLSAGVLVASCEDAHASPHHSPRKRDNTDGQCMSVEHVYCAGTVRWENLLVS